MASGLSAVWLGLRHRLPMSVAWSTPGAALLVATGPPPAAGRSRSARSSSAGLLIVAAGLFPPLGRAVAAIPEPIAGAMLAGVLLPLCTAPVRALVELPAAGRAGGARLAAAAPVRPPLGGARRAAGGGRGHRGDRAASRPGRRRAGAGVRADRARLDAAALVGLALPLFLVTMAAQNVPGMAVLVGYGYRPPFGAALRATGLASAARRPRRRARGQPGRDHRRAGRRPGRAPRPGPPLDRLGDRRRRAGLLGSAPGWPPRWSLLAPPILIEAVAGLALLGALATALASAVADPADREAAVVTFVVTASGVTLLGVAARSGGWSPAG